MFTIEKILAIALSSANKCKTRRTHLPVAPQRNWLTVFLLLFIFCKSLAIHAAPVIVINEQTSRLHLANHVDILDNATHSISIDDILTTQKIHAFAPADLNSTASLKSISPIFWLRFSLTNTSNKAQVFWLAANNTAIEDLILYQLSPTHPEKYDIAPNSPIQHKDYAPVLKEIRIPAHSSATFLIDVHSITKN